MSADTKVAGQNEIPYLSRILKVVLSQVLESDWKSTLVPPQGVLHLPGFIWATSACSPIPQFLSTGKEVLECICVPIEGTSTCVLLYIYILKNESNIFFSRTK